MGHFLTGLLGSLLLTVLFSCKIGDKTVFVFKNNPVFRPDLIALGERFYQSQDQKSLKSFAVLGALDSQLDPCECFMRPYGGLNRIQSYLQKTSAPLVVAGTLTQANVDGSINSSQVAARLTSFFSRVQPLVVGFDIVDLGFWESARTKLSTISLVATNLIFLDKVLESKIRAAKFVDAKIGLRNFRFFYFVSPDRAIAKRIEVANLRETLESQIDQTPPDSAIVVMAENLDDIRPTLSELKLKQRPLILVTSTRTLDHASTYSAGGWLYLQVERRSRSLGELRWDESNSFAATQFVDIGYLESLAQTYDKTLERVVRESRKLPTFKESETGFELSKNEAFLLESIVKSLPSEKTPKTPLKVNSINLSSEYD